MATAISINAIANYYNTVHMVFILFRLESFVMKTLVYVVKNLTASPARYENRDNRKQLRGKEYFIYFIYLYCSDITPSGPSFKTIQNVREKKVSHFVCFHPM